mmetsp:Transcript_25178/g.71155  ORF Transcript_25178/g.71155 Transcript_25178/m.71155 type:complete len:254 (+) Transcript_25178:685-1446(+)
MRSRWETSEPFTRRRLRIRAMQVWRAAPGLAAVAIIGEPVRRSSSRRGKRLRASILAQEATRVRHRRSDSRAWNGCDPPPVPLPLKRRASVYLARSLRCATGMTMPLLITISRPGTDCRLACSYCSCSRTASGSARSFSKRSLALRRSSSRSVSGAGLPAGAGTGASAGAGTCSPSVGSAGPAASKKMVSIGFSLTLMWRSEARRERRHTSDQLSMRLREMSRRCSLAKPFAKDSGVKPLRSTLRIWFCAQAA